VEQSVRWYQNLGTDSACLADSELPVAATRWQHPSEPIQLVGLTVAVLSHSGSCKSREERNTAVLVVTVLAVGGHTEAMSLT
jgi:hypothetical protein